MATVHENYRRRCQETPFRMYNIHKRSGCKVKGIHYELDGEYLESLWTGLCPVFGIELNVPMKDARGKGSNHTAHLDRIDPKQGYIKGNVAWISGRANRIKYDASIEELKQLVSWMESVTTNPDECKGVGSSDSKRETPSGEELVCSA